MSEALFGSFSCELFHADALGLGGAEIDGGELGIGGAYPFPPEPQTAQRGVVAALMDQPLGEQEPSPMRYTGVSG